MTAPAFLLNVDQEELDDLDELLAGYPNAAPIGDPELDAVASRALHAMAREQAEIERYEAAMTAEVDRIRDRYARFILTHETRRARAEEIAKECARRAQFVGKGKSRKVGNGTYGRKTVPEKVSIVDPDKALVFARANCPVAIQTAYKVVHQLVAPHVLAMVKSSGEVPEGFAHTGEHEDAYAKPLAQEGE